LTWIKAPVRHLTSPYGAPSATWEERKMPLLRRWIFSTLRIRESPQRLGQDRFGRGRSIPWTEG